MVGVEAVVVGYALGLIVIAAPVCVAVGVAANVMRMITWFSCCCCCCCCGFWS